MPEAERDEFRASAAARTDLHAVAGAWILCALVAVVALAL